MSMYITWEITNPLEFLPWCIYLTVLLVKCVGKFSRLDTTIWIISSQL